MKDYYVSILVKVFCGLPHRHQLFVLFFNSLGRGNKDISMQFPVYLLFNYCHYKLQLIYTTYVVLVNQGSNAKIPCTFKCKETEHNDVLLLSFSIVNLIFLSLVNYQP